MLVRENQAICIEKLNIKGMLKNKYLAQSISEVGWYSFIEKLKYKAEMYGITLLQIGQFEPSSKTCNKCKYYNNELTLKNRLWKCPDCGYVHDRDINAARNIKNFALQDLCTPGTGGIQASLTKPY